MKKIVLNLAIILTTFLSPKAQTVELSMWNAFISAKALLKDFQKSDLRKALEKAKWNIIISHIKLAEKDDVEEQLHELIVNGDITLAATPDEIAKAIHDNWPGVEVHSIPELADETYKLSLQDAEKGVRAQRCLQGLTLGLPYIGFYAINKLCLLMKFRSMQMTFVKEPGTTVLRFSLGILSPLFMNLSTDQKRALKVQFTADLISLATGFIIGFIDGRAGRPPFQSIGLSYMLLQKRFIDKNLSALWDTTKQKLKQSCALL
ncbi:hypothetical protein ACFLY6_02125 [Candidatus Dependentiae bacterium]